MRTLFISDLHFGHANCIKFDNRPWDNISSMDEDLIRRWNYKVGPDDHVYVVGDFSFRNSRPVIEYTCRLHGHIHLIRGNHDKRTPEYESCFEDAADFAVIPYEEHGKKCRIVLCHYFMPFYYHHSRDVFHLHGHTHKNQESVVEEAIKEELRAKGIRCEAYNVGCMWQNYEPQTLSEIIERQERKDRIQWD